MNGLYEWFNECIFMLYGSKRQLIIVIVLHELVNKSVLLIILYCPKSILSQLSNRLKNTNFTIPISIISIIILFHHSNPTNNPIQSSNNPRPPQSSTTMYNNPLMPDTFSHYRCYLAWMTRYALIRPTCIQYVHEFVCVIGGLFYSYPADLELLLCGLLLCGGWLFVWVFAREQLYCMVQVGLVQIIIASTFTILHYIT